MFISGLCDHGKKNDILMRKYLIAGNTLPTFCDLLNEWHASAITQKLFFIRYLNSVIQLLSLKLVYSRIILSFPHDSASFNFLANFTKNENGIDG